MSHDHSPTSTAPRDAARALSAVIDPVVEALGFEAIFVEWVGSGRHRALRVYIDLLGDGSAAAAAAHQFAEDDDDAFFGEQDVDTDSDGAADADEAAASYEAAAAGPRGVTVADCARVSRALSAALDAAELERPELTASLRAAYSLEVSSPGFDRPLARRAHFDAQVGARVVIKTFTPAVLGSSQRTFHGHVVSTEVDDSQADNPWAGVVVLTDADNATVTYRIELDSIRRANLASEV